MSLALLIYFQNFKGHLILQSLVKIDLVGSKSKRVVCLNLTIKLYYTQYAIFARGRCSMLFSELKIDQLKKRKTLDHSGFDFLRM